jgi:TnpA family transposase
MINILSENEKNELTEIQEDISKEEIIKFYTLTRVDLINSNRYKKGYNRLGFAIQICILRHKGWPLSYIKKIPSVIIEYISDQLRVLPTSFELYHNRKNTLFEHFKNIKEIYKYENFSDEHKDLYDHFLKDLLKESSNPFFLVYKYIEKLKEKSVVLPAVYKIEEIIGEARIDYENTIINKLFSQILKKQQLQLDGLLQINVLTGISNLAWLRNNNGKSSTEEFLDISKRLNIIRNINLNIDLSSIPVYLVDRYVKLGKKYEPFSLKRFEDKKRYTILAVYLIDLQSDLFDRLIIIHDIKMNNIFKKINKTKNNQVKKYQKLTTSAVNDYIQIGDILINAKENGANIDKTIENTITWEKFKSSISEAKNVSAKTQKSTLDMIDNYYSELRKYTPTLLKQLTFKTVSNNCVDLEKAVEVIKSLNFTKKINLPNDIDIEFTNKKWKNHIAKNEGSKKRHYYELAVLNELKNNIRAGNMAVEGSKSFKNFENYLISKEEWKNQKFTTKLVIEDSFEKYIKSKKEKLHSLFKWYSKNYNALENVILEDDKIRLKKLEADKQEEAEKLSNELYKMLPRISLPDILFEISKLTGFDKQFVHAANNKVADSFEDIKTLIFAIMGIGTNVGLSKISESINGVTYKQLVHTADWKIFDENLQNAQAVLTNYQLNEHFSEFWGNGTTSSSDGMRVVSRVNSLNSENNPKLGFEKGITIHRFVNDKYSAFYTTVSSPGKRDSIHVIDGLIRHKSELKIKEHYTDTAGYTDQVFALTSLMGFHFAPRLRNLPNLKLFSIGKNDFSNLSKLVTGSINVGLVEKNFDNILRLAHSIREEKVTSSLLLTKLGSYSRKNSLANALKEMGKIEKTIFILEYASKPKLRRRIQIGLNKGEELNGLARVVFFGRRGQFWEHELQEQLQKASCLNILLNAIVIWNTKYLTKAWKLYKKNNPNADEKLLKYISPLNWEHINFLGKYSFDKDIEFEEDNLRKLNIY